MTWSTIADAVVVAHLAYLAFVAVGGILAWRWPWVIWFHLAAVTWSVAILVVGQDCPLTDLQRYAEREAGQPRDDRGFVDRYLEGVLFPDRYTTLLQILIAALVIIGWVGFWHRHGGARHEDRRAPSAPAGS